MYYQTENAKMEEYNEREEDVFVEQTDFVNFEGRNMDNMAQEVIKDIAEDAVEDAEEMEEERFEENREEENFQEKFEDPNQDEERFGDPVEEVFVDGPVDVVVDAPEQVIIDGPVDVIDAPEEVIIDGPVDVVVDAPEEVFVDGPVDVVVDAPEEVIIDGPVDVVVDAPEEVIIDGPVDVVVVDAPEEVFVDGPVDVVVDAPEEVFVDGPVDVVVDAPEEVIIDGPVDVVADAPEEVIIDGPVDVVVDAPEEVIIDGPVDVVVDAPEEVIIDGPVDVVVDAPEEVIIDGPVDVVVDAPEEVFVDGPVDVVVDAPEEVFVDGPVDVVVDAPEEVIIDGPVDVVVDAPEEVFVDRPVDVVFDVPIEQECVFIPQSTEYQRFETAQQFDQVQQVPYIQPYCQPELIVDAPYIEMPQQQSNIAQQIELAEQVGEIVVQQNQLVQPNIMVNGEVVIVEPLIQKIGAIGEENLSTFMESDAYYLSAFEWKLGRAIIENKLFKIPTKSMMINEISKIKCFKDLALNGSRKIKVTHSLATDYHFSVEPKAHFNGLPLQYYWFAKLITMKLIEKGCDLNNPYIPEAKFKIEGTPQKYVSGILYKQSQYLKNWELRYIVISPEGLFSFKDQSSSESFKILRDTATELWTRFQIREKMLIIKVLHSGRKTEFCIPITDYTVNSNSNWLYSFYRLIFEN